MSNKNTASVAKIEKSCFANPWSLTSFESELGNKNAIYFVAAINGEVIGYAGMHHILDEGYITNVAVSPDYRRRGAAGLLLKKILEYANDNKLAFVTLEVRESNSIARYFYEKLSFIPAGRRKNFYTNPTEDGIIMTKEFLY